MIIKGPALTEVQFEIKWAGLAVALIVIALIGTAIFFGSTSGGRSWGGT